MKKKKNFLFIVLISSFSFQLFAQKNHYHELITKRADRIEQKVIGWRQDIHQNPELGNREFHTAELVAKHLQSLGIAVKTKVAVTGVVGILKGDKPGPVIALRADMDALPIEERNELPFASTVKTVYNGNETSVMHACGHDAHVAILMGVAEILSELKSNLKGTVVFIFQPAEEGAPKGEEAGAELMIKEGVLEDPKVEAIFGLHVSAGTEVGKIIYRPEGTSAGSANFKITVKGKPGHGATPWLTVDPVLAAAQIVNNLHTIVSRNVNITKNAAVLSVGAINGGNRDNIIPETVEMLGTVRVFNETDEKIIFSRIREVAENTAKAAGATATIELPYTKYYPVTYNSPALTTAMLPSLQKSAGSENVILIPQPTFGEDFSYYAQKVPGLYFQIGGLPKGQDPTTAGGHHTPDFKIDDSAFKTGVIAFCNLVFDYSELNGK